MSLTIRRSDEIMKEIMYLFNEYVQAKETEEAIQHNRLDYLETELSRQYEKNKQIAAILAGN
jgi:hypothetical protein